MKTKIIVNPTDPVDLFSEEIMKIGSVELQRRGKSEPIKDSNELIERAHDAYSEKNQDLEDNIEKSLSLSERMEKI